MGFCEGEASFRMWPSLLCSKETGQLGGYGTDSLKFENLCSSIVLGRGKKGKFEKRMSIHVLSVMRQVIYLVTSMAIPVEKYVIFLRFFGYFFKIFIVFFFVLVEVLPVTPLLNGVFVHKVFCAYFVRFEGAGVMRRFLWCTQENI